jgi:HMG box factor, other
MEWEESVQLPPLQTHMATSPQSGGPGSSSGGIQHSATAPPSSAIHHYNPHHHQTAGFGNSSVNASSSRGGGDSQARGIEAMVMSIGYMNKLTVLNTISAPLKAPGPTSPGVDVRGPVIALEGANPHLLAQVAPVVERALAASGECLVRTWSSVDSDAARQLLGGGGGSHQQRDQRMSISTTASGASSRPESAAGVGGGISPFAAYLQIILEWHAKSTEVTKFVTTAPAQTPAPAPLASTSTASSAAEATADNSTVVVATSASTPASSVAACPSSSASSSAAHSHHSTPVPPPSSSSATAAPSPPPTKSGLTPVALLTGGYRMSISDRCACAVPIGDAYAPVDHWQWMATQWRGIVGPDLVVYVRAASDDEMRGQGGAQGQGQNQGQQQLAAVEMKAPGLMVVRIAGGTLAEKVERRLGFEVLEWVRGGSYREGFRGV